MSADSVRVHVLTDGREVVYRDELRSWRWWHLCHAARILGLRARPECRPTLRVRTTPRRRSKAAVR